MFASVVAPAVIAPAVVSNTAVAISKNAQSGISNSAITINGAPDLTEIEKRLDHLSDLVESIAVDGTRASRRPPLVGRNVAWRPKAKDNAVQSSQSDLMDAAFARRVARAYGVRNGDLMTVDLAGRTLLHRVAMDSSLAGTADNSLRFVRRLLDDGVEINVCSSDRDAPLAVHCALKSGNFDLYRMIVTHPDCDVAHATNDGLHDGGELCYNLIESARDVYGWETETRYAMALDLLVQARVECLFRLWTKMKWTGIYSWLKGSRWCFGTEESEADHLFKKMMIHYVSLSEQIPDNSPLYDSIAPLYDSMIVVITTINPSLARGLCSRSVQPNANKVMLQAADVLTE